MALAAIVDDKEEEVRGLQGCCLCPLLDLDANLAHDELGYIALHKGSPARTQDQGRQPHREKERGVWKVTSIGK
uniref:Uncharacterized protein n=1 Tax=Oryza punctata TaxID=4537 RepID=A0A0E0KFS3_ORYPU